MDNVLQQIEQMRLVPVVTIQRIEDADEMLGALVAGGLPVAEICFRTDCAEEAIKLAVKKYPDMLVGAGTVINKEQCERAIKAGAKFIVSPGLSEEVAEVCKEKDVPYLPGIVTPTEIMKALSLGLTNLKFFPAGNFGGLNTIKALSAAFPLLCTRRRRHSCASTERPSAAGRKRRPERSSRGAQESSASAASIRKAHSRGESGGTA